MSAKQNLPLQTPQNPVCLSNPWQPTGRKSALSKHCTIIHPFGPVSKINLQLQAPQNYSLLCQPFLRLMGRFKACKYVFY